MRVAIDARELTGQPTGVGRVLSGLLDAWPEDDELLLYGREPVPWRFLDGRRRARIFPGSRRMPGSVWEQTVLPAQLRRDRADVLFSPAYGMPVDAPCGVVVGMHDCACVATPGEFGWRERRRRQWAASTAARRARYLLTGSRFAAGEIRSWYGVPHRRVVVADYGLGDGFGPVDEAAVAAARERYGIRGRSVLFVGAPLGRRDLAGLAAAIDELADSRSDVRLYGVGPDRRRGATRRLSWLGYVAEQDLPAVYAAATVVAYPSEYEGFGFPVLEALACGTPVVASAAGSLAEIFDGRAWLVENRREPWLEALATLLDDEGERRRWIDTAQPWALDRRWGGAARLLRRLLRDAAGVAGGNGR